MANGYFFNFDKLEYVQGQRPPGCILCHIRDCNPVSVDLSVYRDSLFIVSMNLYPYNPGHIMIVPCRHIKDIRLFTPEEDARFAALNRLFLDILDELYSPSGYNLGYNMGLSSGASIEHLHYHLIPRYPRELGVADLIAGQRVLVEDPLDSRRRIQEAVTRNHSLGALEQR